MAIVDISNPLEPTLLSHQEEMSEAGPTFYSIATSEKYAYLGGYHGLEIFDISNPQSPVSLSSRFVDWDQRFVAAYLTRDYMYLAGADRLVIFNVSDPATPEFYSYSHEAFTQ